jgi:ankyrin repeat protein
MLDDRLVKAAQDGRTEDVVELLKEILEFNPKCFDEEIYLAMLWAATCNNTDTMQTLLTMGANVNSAHYRGHKILASAAGAGSIEAVNLLIEKGAIINAVDPWGKTALHYAIQKKRSFELIKILLVAGADPSIKDANGRSPLDEALLISSTDDKYKPLFELLKAKVNVF